MQSNDRNFEAIRNRVKAIKSKPNPKSYWEDGLRKLGKPIERKSRRQRRGLKERHIR